MKGMQKIKRGTGFRGALDYCFSRDATNKENLGVFIGGNMTGTTARALAAEFSIPRNIRPDINKPVWHNCLRLPKDEKLTEAEWCSIADDYLNSMGFTPLHQRAYILHDDLEGQHIHIVASRVGLDGSLYLGKNENLESTRQIGILEHKHGLTITKGPEYTAEGKVKMPDKKKPKKGAIEKALKDEVEPVILQLQNVINKVLECKLPVLQFIEELHIAGVEAVPNINKAGLNGFSFGINGIYYKGSELGAAYIGKKLLERGLNYDEIRDGTELKNIAAKHRQLRRTQKNTERTARTAEGNTELTGRHSATGSTAFNSTRIDTEAAAVSEAAGKQRTANEPINKSNRPAQLWTDSEYTEAVDMDSGISESKPERVKPWSSRFKQASAARKRESQGVDNAIQQPKPANSVDAKPYFSQSEIAQAKAAAMTSILTSAGYTLIRDGRNRYETQCKTYAIAAKDNKWLFYNTETGTGGDAIQLVQELENCSFISAVNTLNNSETLLKHHITTVKQHKTDILKPVINQSNDSKAEERGMAYLKERGISTATQAEAVKQGFLQYALDGILFIGKLGEEIRSATKRFFTNQITKTGKQYNKSDITGSDKSYAPMLTGSTKQVWIVEGGTDALAVYDYHLKQAQQEVPTIIVSGGAGIRSFLEENERVRTILQQASSVIVAKEVEKNANTQAKTDAAHNNQMTIIRSITSAEVSDWTPSVGKDFAEFWLLTQEKQSTTQEKTPHRLRHK
jgi:hypothetical protein